MGRGEAQGMPGETTYTILIVEDDATIARLLQENLARWGFDAGASRIFRTCWALLRPRART